MAKSDGREVPDHLPDQLNPEEVLELLEEAQSRVEETRELLLRARSIMASAVMRQREELGRRRDPTGEISVAEELLEELFAGK